LTRERSLVGALQRDWRRKRHLSQLALAAEANVSQRHLSFIESGRAAPSRESTMRVAGALDLRLRSRNELLLAAGYAPRYPERALDAGRMRAAEQALERMLTHHEPFPAVVLDRAWDVIKANAAAERLIKRAMPGSGRKLFPANGKLNLGNLQVSACRSSPCHPVRCRSRFSRPFQASSNPLLLRSCPGSRRRRLSIRWEGPGFRRWSCRS